VLLTALQNDGFRYLQPEYLEYWLHSGQKINFKESDIQREMIIEGLAPNGYLRALEPQTGSHYELHPDNTSLNF